MTLLTRGKKDVTFQIPDDTDDSYAQYKSAVKHIAADRKDKGVLAEKLSGKGFDGECCSSSKACAPENIAGRPARFVLHPAMRQPAGLASHTMMKVPTLDGTTLCSCTLNSSVSVQLCMT